jgi:hypothetical protein
MQLKNVHHVPSIKKNLVSDSLLYWNGYKRLWINWIYVAKVWDIVKKNMIVEGCSIFFLYDDVSNKVVNNVIILDKLNI